MSSEVQLVNLESTLKPWFLTLTAACIRRMMGGYVFTRICLLTYRGYPILLTAGTPIWPMWGILGYPIRTGWGSPLPIQTGWGTPPVRTRLRYPHIRTGWGTPSVRTRWRYPHIRTGWGYPPPPSEDGAAE